MRFIEKTQQSIQIAPRTTQTDALGGAVEAFSTTHTTVRANVLPPETRLEHREHGLTEVSERRILLPVGTTVSVGDALCIGTTTPNWRVTAVRTWTDHITVTAEKITI